MWKPTLAAVTALALVAAGTAAAAFGPSVWDREQVGLGWPLWEPADTFGLQPAKVTTLSCAPAAGVSISVAYGKAYEGRNFGKVRGFTLAEGFPSLCGNAGGVQVVGSTTIRGVRVPVMVYCNRPGTCRLADGFRHGYVLQWRMPPVNEPPLRGRTQIFMDSSRLTLPQLLKIARSLAPA
jgi:hypothetical protein